MKYLIIILAFLLTSCDDLKIEEMIYTSVKVITSPTSNGSGFIVKSDETGSWIITAHHVLESDETLVKIYPEKKSFNATVIDIDEELDVVLIKIEEQHKSARLSFENKPIFTRVYAVGAGTGFESYPTEGIVALNSKEWLIFTAPVEYGKSGGAVFARSNDKYHYEVIGMIHGIGVHHGFIERMPIWHQAYAIPMIRIKEFLAKNNIGVEK